MAGYTRQSVADIIANAVIKAAPVNAEYNAIRDAFALSGGHRHDGSSTEGAYVPLIADTDALNKVVVDTSNNRISFFSEVSGSAVEQVRIQDGAIVPVTDDDIDLGTSSLKFKDVYIDGVGYFDSISVSGTAAFSNIDINGGTIDGASIGASSADAGSFTTISSSGQSTLASVDINGGAVDGTVIGATTPSSVAATTVTASSGFTGALTGQVTGNVTGNVSGDLTGDVTGNVTANSGLSTFNNVTVNGTLDVTGTTIANVTDPSSAQDAATKNYVDTQVAGVIDSAPGTLDTLNELAAALGDDANFSTTITNSIATKLPLAGGTMSGAIAMGTNKITGLGDPTANQDAATKKYTTDTFLPLAGGTLTGAIDMGSQKITTTYTPSNGPDLTNKTYVDGLFGSSQNASTSASQAQSSATSAATSATNAANSATAAASSETNAAASATSAAASFDDFDDRYLGPKSSAPTVDNDGDALVAGALYFNTSVNILYVYSTGGAWQAAGSSVNGTSGREDYVVGTSSGSYNGSTTTFPATYDPGFVDVYMNGIKLAPSDFTSTNGTTIVLGTAASTNDVISIVGYGTFTLGNMYTQAQSDARYAQLSGATFTGDVDFGSNKITYSNMYNNLNDLPSASTYHGMFAHVHGTGKAYFAHAGNWIQLVSPETSGDYDFGSNKITYSNVYSQESDLPSASTYHGMFAHVHGTGKGYFAHAGNWVKLVNENSSGGVVLGSNWTVTESGGSLYFATGGVNKMKLDANGNLDVVGAVNANATIT